MTTSTENRHNQYAPQSSRYDPCVLPPYLEVSLQYRRCVSQGGVKGLGIFGGNLEEYLRAV